MLPFWEGRLLSSDNCFHVRRNKQPQTTTECQMKVAASQSNTNRTNQTWNSTWSPPSSSKALHFSKPHLILTLVFSQIFYVILQRKTIYFFLHFEPPGSGSCALLHSTTPAELERLFAAKNTVTPFYTITTCVLIHVQCVVLYLSFKSVSEDDQGCFYMWVDLL